MSDISDKLPEFKEKKKLLKDIENWENLYKETKPLALITINNIPHDFVLNEESKQIPNFFYEKAEQIILALSLTFFSPIQPIYTLLTNLETGRKLGELIVPRGLTILEYKKVFAEELNFNEEIKNLWKIVSKIRILDDATKDSIEDVMRIRTAIEFYRTGLASASLGKYGLGIGLRFVHYWTVLEVLSGKFKKNRKEGRASIKRMLNHHFPNEKWMENSIVNKWADMRNSTVHDGKPLEKFDLDYYKLDKTKYGDLEKVSYPKENGELRKLIRRILLKVCVSETPSTKYIF